MRLPPTDMTRPLHLPPSSTPIRRISADCKKTRLTWDFCRFWNLTTALQISKSFHNRPFTTRLLNTRPAETVSYWESKRARLLFFSRKGTLLFSASRVWRSLLITHFWAKTTLHRNTPVTRWKSLKSIKFLYIRFLLWLPLLYTACKSLFLISPLPALSL